MSGRAFVLIFLFWALLTLITPTLVSWSSAARSNLESKANLEGSEQRARRMIAYAEMGPRRRGKTAAKPPVQAPAPSPAPIPYSKLIGN
ncbi:hypothetical protein H6P81_009648 [Aristolochia fimbriata]|uniref:Uncharacterized protein n=1 Tax=Aristolochia fimbriata TaxID=158543 RepID=A0AAV7ELL8_ARIFI|nr:hypothetical protein H6P81_009648 [Aristolochia fimbriata]